MQAVGGDRPSADHPLHQQVTMACQLCLQGLVLQQGGGPVAEVVDLDGGGMDGEGLQLGQQLANKWGHRPQCDIE